MANNFVQVAGFLCYLKVLGFALKAFKLRIKPSEN